MHSVYIIVHSDSEMMVYKYVLFVVSLMGFFSRLTLFIIINPQTVLRHTTTSRVFFSTFSFLCVSFFLIMREMLSIIVVDVVWKNWVQPRRI